MKNFTWILVAVVAVGLLVLQQRKIAQLHRAADEWRAQVAEARAEVQRAAESAKPDPAEAERVKEERAELLKLRGEVSVLRQEKIDRDKKAALDRAAAEAAAHVESEKKQTQTAQAMQWVENVLAAPTASKGLACGNLRRKFLAREPLNEAEQALLARMLSKTGEIEKSPQEFAAFQSAFIGSLLGWNDDPRMAQVQTTLTRASQAANERGFDYHAPGENADKWDDAQKALNTRATGAVQGVLTSEERAVFDKAFLGVLGIDFGIGMSK